MQWWVKFPQQGVQLPKVPPILTVIVNKRPEYDPTSRSRAMANRALFKLIKGGKNDETR